MVLTEPVNLREWMSAGRFHHRGRLFTCGRPGRATHGRDKVAIGEDIIDLWAGGLPKADVLHIVSLLGHKKGGYSEFAYYPFRSSHELGTKPKFEDWLNERYGPRFVVHEFPTVDAQDIPPAILEAASRRVPLSLRIVS